VKVAQALLEVERIFLDSAPVIYFVENHPAYAPVLSEIFSGDSHLPGDCHLLL